MSGKRVGDGAKSLREKINKIKEEIRKAAEELKSSQSLDDDIAKKQRKLRNLIQTLETKALEFPEAARIIGVPDQIQGLIRDIEFPNLPRQNLSQAQLGLQEEARQIIDLWSSAGVGGVDYDSLSAESKEQVNSFIVESELNTILAEQLQGNYTHFKRGPANAQEMMILLTSIKKLFQKKIAESCINDRGEIDISPDIPDHRKYLKTLAATSVGSILKSLTGPLSIPNVLVSAAAEDPAKFIRDAGSLLLAGGVLGQCLPQGFGGGVVVVRDVARAITTFMAHNPVETFVSGQWITGYIKHIYNMALRQMYPGLNAHTIMGIVEGMNVDFLERSRVGLTGEVPVDVVTLTGKLRYLIYLFKDICVGQAAFTGDIVRQALDFPNNLCRLAKYAIDKLKSLSASASAQLMGRYRIIPGESLETFEDLLMNLMKIVEFDDEQAVKPFLIRLLTHNHVETAWDVSVDFLRAQSDVLNPIPGNTGSDSLECAASETPQAPLSPYGPLEGSGILPDVGTIPGQPYNSSQYMWGDWLAILRFLTSPRMGEAPDPDPGARGAQAPGAAARPLPGQHGAQSFAQGGNSSFIYPPPCAQFARGGDSGVIFPPPGSQVPVASAAASAAPPPSCTRGGVRYAGPSLQGGRSHSHKRSASKRTRHKVHTGKKQKS